MSRMPEVKMDLGPLRPLPSDWDKPARKPRRRRRQRRADRTRQPVVQCKYCGMPCLWGQFDGKWRLVALKGNVQHRCRRRRAILSAWLEERNALNREARALMERDSTPK